MAVRTVVDDGCARHVALAVSPCSVPFEGWRRVECAPLCSTDGAEHLPSAARVPARSASHSAVLRTDAAAGDADWGRLARGRVGGRGGVLESPWANEPASRTVVVFGTIPSW